MDERDYLPPSAKTLKREAEYKRLMQGTYDILEYEAKKSNVRTKNLAKLYTEYFECECEYIPSEHLFLIKKNTGEISIKVSDINISQETLDILKKIDQKKHQNQKNENNN